MVRIPGLVARIGTMLRRTRTTTLVRGLPVTHASYNFLTLSNIAQDDLQNGQPVYPPSGNKVMGLVKRLVNY